MAFRGTNENIDPDKIELFRVAGVDQSVLSILSSTYCQKWKFLKRKPFILIQTISEGLIEIIVQKVHVLIMDEVNSSGYVSLSVDSTPDLSHIGQLSVVLRYVVDEEPIDSFLTFYKVSLVKLWLNRCCSTSVKFAVFIF